MPAGSAQPRRVDEGAHGTGRRPVSDAAAAKAWELERGNPLLLEQVALAIGRGAFDAEAGKNWPALETDGLLLSRFAGLPREALRCVRAASVLGFASVGRGGRGCRTGSDRRRPGGRGALSERPGRTDHAGRGALRASTVRAQALYDDLPGSGALGCTPAASRCWLSEGWTRKLRSTHRAGLRDAPEVVAALERAGRAALDVGALETAAAQLTTAVELAGDRAATSLLLARRRRCWELGTRLRRPSPMSGCCPGGSEQMYERGRCG